MSTSARRGRATLATGAALGLLSAPLVVVAEGVGSTSPARLLADVVDPLIGGLDAGTAQAAADGAVVVVAGILLLGLVGVSRALPGRNRVIPAGTFLAGTGLLVVALARLIGSVAPDRVIELAAPQTWSWRDAPALLGVGAALLAVVGAVVLGAGLGVARMRVPVTVALLLAALPLGLLIVAAAGRASSVAGIVAICPGLLALATAGLREGRVGHVDVAGRLGAGPARPGKPAR